MKVTRYIHRVHIPSGKDDPSLFHPGGTNMYFVGQPADEMVLIDAGEHFREWTRRIIEAHQELGEPDIKSILITHSHSDHIGGLDRLQEHFSIRGQPCQVRCHPRLVNRLGQVLGEGMVTTLGSREVIKTGGGISIRALFTPGHEHDHVCYYIPRKRVMFTGDTILGASSTVVSDLTSYMRSLELLEKRQPKIICPGHGPVVNDAVERIRSYINHRRLREDQVVLALEEGITSVEGIVSRIYPPTLPAELRSAAGRNIRTHLTKLREEGRVIETPASYALT